MFLEGLAYKVLGTRDCSKLFLWVPKALFTVIGNWPQIKRPIFISITYFLIQLTYLMFIEIGIYNNIDFDLDKLGENMFSFFMVPSVFQVICKFCICFYKSNELSDIVDIVMFNFWPYDLIDDLKAQLKKFYLLILAFNISMLVVGVIFGILLMVIPQYQDERSLPFNVKYSFDYTSSPLYETLFITNIVVFMSVMICCTMGTDLLFMNIVAAISVQFRILQKCFEAYNTKEMININNKLRNLNIGPAKECYDIRKEYFVKCIKHHQLLLKFTKKVNAFFDIILLLQLSSSLSTLCVIIYAITQTYSDTTLLSWTALIGYLVQLLTYCLLGNDLNYQASLLPQYIFQSEWKKLENKGLKRDVMFLIQHAQQLPRLSCYELYDMNMGSFISVLKLSFSLFTLLSKVSR